jgi:zinc protease
MKTALALGLAAAGALALPAAVSAAPSAAALQVPVEYHTLDNGLKVVISKDATAPIATVAVYYNIGFRNEPRDRTGFAHLFEHMMFQGSENLGKMEFARVVQKNGGVFNGSTRFDFTNYFEIVPSHVVETALWAEADRMKGLAITQENLTNQQGVVTNEVKVNVLNQPYGGFPWLDMPQYANTNWHNAHNFYGDLKDLEAATLGDVKSFFEKYYAPSNAAVVVVGDVDPVQTLGWIKQYFGPLPKRPVPQQPDISEPRQDKEKRASKPDPLATRPALAASWHMPPRNTPEYYAMGLVDQILVQGKDSRLYREMVQVRGLTGEVAGGINLLGHMFNISGPVALDVYLFHDQDKTPEQILAALDTEVKKLQDVPVDKATLDRARVKMRSALYDAVDGFFGFGRADLLASYALFDNDPSKINSIEAEFEKVTPALVQKVAREYLRTSNRTVLVIEPKKDEKAADAGAAAQGGIR